MSWPYFIQHDVVDTGQRSENTPRDAEGKPQVGFVESRRMEPEVLGWIRRVREGRLPK